MSRDPNYASRLRTRAWLLFSRRCSFAVMKACAMAEAKGAALLYVIAPFIAVEHATYFPPEFEPTDTDLMGAFEEACTRISRKLKTCIDERLIPVRHLHGLDYANDAADIMTWCATCDRERPFDQDMPPIPFVVMKEELEPFFTLLGSAPPRELMTDTALRRREAVEHDSARSSIEAVVCRIEDLRRKETTERESEHRVYWLQVFDAHYAEIETLQGGNAGVNDVIRYLKRLGDPRIPDDGLVDGLIWETEEGVKKRVTKKTISTRLSLRRKR